MSTESERIGDSDCKVGLDSFVRGVIKVALGIGFIQIDCRRHYSVTQGENSCNCLRCTCSAEHMAGHGFD